MCVDSLLDMDADHRDTNLISSIFKQNFVDDDAYDNYENNLHSEHITFVRKRKPRSKYTILTRIQLVITRYEYHRV